MLESHVYADGKIGKWKLLLHLNLTGENDIPVLTLAFDCGSLRFPDHGSMVLDFDMANLGKDDLAVFDLYCWLAFELFNLWIAKAIIAVIPLKSRISGFFSLLHALEEVLECFVHTLQGV